MPATKRPLVLAIYEPRWFIHVMNTLNNRGIPYKHYYTPGQIPPYSILYTDYEYFVVEVGKTRRDVEIHYDPETTCRGLEEAVLASMNKEKYNTLTIGIDPGPKPYYLVLGDGLVLKHGRTGRDKLAETIMSELECYPSIRKLVRIGMGHDGASLAVELAETLGNILVELVDEKETTPKSRGNNSYLFDEYYQILKPYRNKDAYAALRIAVRRGVEVREV